MGITLSPIVKLARRFVLKHSLRVPFDINSLLENYAEVVYKVIPIDGVDGICLNLKTVGRTPKVIINANAPQTRQKFTLAHELGHIIIPWHYGNFIDVVIEDNVTPTYSHYWELEKEANKFASEILMPFEWIFSLYKNNSDPNYLLFKVCENCGVSEIAAKIRLIDAINEIENILIPHELIQHLYQESNNLATVQKVLVENTRISPRRVAELMAANLSGRIAYCLESEKIVIGSGGTSSSYPYYQYEGSDFLPTPYFFFKSHIVSSIEGINTHWWVLDREFIISEDNRSWREILNKIAVDISPAQGEMKFKATVNGKVAGFHGSWKTKNIGIEMDKFLEDLIYRFNHPEFNDFLKHPDFLIFMKKRCQALF